jgi:FMN phosphatase YigB (HAD superfamily)
MLNESINTLIFDLDNTLIDRNAALRLGLQGLLKRIYTEPERQTVLDDIMRYDNWGYTSRDEFCSWFRRTYGGEVLGEDVVSYFTNERLQKIFRLMIFQNMGPSHAVQAALHSLTTRFQLVLASNGSSDTQRWKLCLAQLESFFQPEAIFISGEMDCEKPDPLFFQKIMQKLQLDPGNTMVIGDNLIHDIQGAAACGLFTCWMSHGREGVEGIKPNMVITNITETVKWTRQLI